jgi:hypothetical protein
MGRGRTCEEPLALTIHGSQPVYERLESHLSAGGVVSSVRDRSPPASGVVSLFHEGFEFDDGIDAAAGASEPACRLVFSRRSSGGP